jgi:RimJ/RimL family protein N-acetyltransferase
VKRSGDGIHVTLDDGRTVSVRPLSAGDEQALATAFRRLSEQSRVLRFGSAAPALTGQQLRHLVRSVDGESHVAIAAFAEGDSTRMVGVGRILRYPDDPQTLDVGITVADEYQGHGLGLVLAQQLALRRPRQARRIVTQVASGNHAALRLLDEFGTVDHTSTDGRTEVVLPSDS